VEDVHKTLKAYKRLIQICDDYEQCCVQLSEVVNERLLPLLSSPLHTKVCEKLVSLALRSTIEV